MDTRLDWTITKRAMWIALHKDGLTLCSRTKSGLMSKINESEKGEKRGN